MYRELKMEMILNKRGWKNHPPPHTHTTKILQFRFILGLASLQKNLDINLGHNEMKSDRKKAEKNKHPHPFSCIISWSADPRKRKKKKEKKRQALFEFWHDLAHLKHFSKFQHPKNLYKKKRNFTVLRVFRILQT